MSQANQAGEQDQERLLDEAASVVKEQAYYMKKAIDGENLRDALKFSSNLICELRTSLLSPRNYYELYMLVFSELLHLAAFFADKGRHGRKMAELYESVQHAGNILPRLYLLITVGAAYIKSREATPRQILKDMSELTKGVQHPMRGLFLRYYLSQMCKDKLPDTGSEYEGPESGNVDDAFEFILTNFSQSNRLWVRLQHQGPVKDKVRREKERHDLRVLVGSNLVRLSQLEGLTLPMYTENVLPKLTEQIISSKDAMAQQYLLDCIIQVFPDEFHMRTLEQLLGTCTKVVSSVDLKHIMVNLMTRLAQYCQRNDEIVPPDIDIFNLFLTHLTTIIERIPEKDAKDDTGSLLELLSAFLNFTLTLYPSRVDYVDVILNATVSLLYRHGYSGLDDGKKLDGSSVDTVVELLSTPLRSLSLEVLSLEHYPNLFRTLSFHTRKQVAVSMVDTVLEANLSLTRVEDLNRFFSFISPLVKDDEDTPIDEAVGEDFINEQIQVCKLMNQIRHEDPEEVLKLIAAARSFFGQGGPQRMKYTLVPLVYKALNLLPRVDELQAERDLLAARAAAAMAPTSPPVPLSPAAASVSAEAAVELPKTPSGSGSQGNKSPPGSQQGGEEVNVMNTSIEESPPAASENTAPVTFAPPPRTSAEHPAPAYVPPLDLPALIAPKKVLQFVYKTITALVSCSPEMAFHLWLQCAKVTEACKCTKADTAFCAEFLSQALICYEEEINDSREQSRCLSLMINTVRQLTTISEEEYDNFCSKLSQHAAKLLKKPQQCKAVLLCSHLFWADIKKDSGHVLQCLQKCLKIADNAIQTSSDNVGLLVEILDRYIYFFEADLPDITVQYITNLIALCQEHCVYAGSENVDARAARTHFLATLKFLREHRKMDERWKDRYAELPPACLMVQF